MQLEGAVRSPIVVETIVVWLGVGVQMRATAESVWRWQEVRLERRGVRL